MADIEWADVLGIASELASVAVEAQQAILAYVNTSLKPTYLGGVNSFEFKLARMYLAAHMGSPKGGAVAGPVASESAGGLARTYAIMMGTNPRWSSTRYGIEFEAMLFRSGAKGGLVV